MTSARHRVRRMKTGKKVSRRPTRRAAPVAPAAARRSGPLFDALRWATEKGEGFPLLLRPRVARVLHKIANGVPILRALRSEAVKWAQWNAWLRYYPALQEDAHAALALCDSFRRERRLERADVIAVDGFIHEHVTGQGEIVKVRRHSEEALFRLLDKDQPGNPADGAGVLGAGKGIPYILYPAQVQAVRSDAPKDEEG